LKSPYPGDRRFSKPSINPNAFDLTNLNVAPLTLTLFLGDLWFKSKFYISLYLSLPAEKGIISFPNGDPILLFENVFSPIFFYY
jgi:hypothetical protein